MQLFVKKGILEDMMAVSASILLDREAFNK
jgi:hypothetical protein